MKRSVSASRVGDRADENLLPAAAEVLVKPLLPPVDRLLWFVEAPKVLRYNKYIRSGYRSAITYPQAWASMLQYHNETGNIWSHGIPILLILAAVTTGMALPWRGHSLIFWLDVCTKCSCMMASVCYHTCMTCHHHYHHWLKLDICGIMVMSMSSWHATIWWGLPCHHHLRIALLTLYVACGLVATHLIIFAQSAKGRAKALGLVWITRMAALGCRCALRSGSPIGLMYHVCEEMAGLAGGVINALKVPERWVSDPAEIGLQVPGLFDYWCNSHQIMHVLAVIGITIGHFALRHDAMHYDNTTCAHPGLQPSDVSM